MKFKKTAYFLSVILTAILIFAFNVIYFNIKYPLKYKQEIIKYSTQFNLQPTFVASVINAESSFNCNAVSKKGAIGLMQILPSTASYIANLLNEPFENVDLFNADTNIKYGCFYLNYLENKFKTEKEVLCAYNAGETVVNNWLRNTNLSSDGKILNNIPYPVTKNYAQKIMQSKKYYLGRI